MLAHLKLADILRTLHIPEEALKLDKIDKSVLLKIVNYLGVETTESKGFSIVTTNEAVSTIQDLKSFANNDDIITISERNSKPTSVEIPGPQLEITTESLVRPNNKRRKPKD